MMREAVNLIDKQNIMCLQVREQRGKIPLSLDGRSRRLTKIRPHLIRNNRRECCFAKPGRSIEKDVIQSFVAGKRRLDKFGQIRLRLVLPDILTQPTRAQTVLPSVRTLLLKGHQLLILVHIQR